MLEYLLSLRPPPHAPELFYVVFMKIATEHEFSEKHACILRVLHQHCKWDPNIFDKLYKVPLSIIDNQNLKKLKQWATKRKLPIAVHLPEF